MSARTWWPGGGTRPGSSRRRPAGWRDFRYLTALLTQPLARWRRAPDKPVWHCAVRAAPGDPDLGDGAWMAIAEEIMHRTGLSRRGEEGTGVRWVAVHHGSNHIHIVAVLARQDGRRAALHNDYYRIGEALRDMEAEYGLVAVARCRPDRGPAADPGRGREGRPDGRAEAPRVTLQRHAAAAAAAAGSEAEFFGLLERAGLRVRLRRSSRDPGQVTGYAIALDDDKARTASRCGTAAASWPPTCPCPSCGPGGTRPGPARGRGPGGPDGSGLGPRGGRRGRRQRPAAGRAARPGRRRYRVGHGRRAAGRRGRARQPGPAPGRGRLRPGRPGPLGPPAAAVAGRDPAAGRRPAGRPPPRT